VAAANEVIAEGLGQILCRHIDRFQSIKAVVHIYNLEKLFALVFILFQLDWLILDSSKPGLELLSGEKGLLASYLVVNMF